MKKNNYVVQLKYVDVEGYIREWEGIVLGPLRSSEEELIQGVSDIIAVSEDMDYVPIVPGSFFYSYMPAK